MSKMSSFRTSHSNTPISIDKNFNRWRIINGRGYYDLLWKRHLLTYNRRKKCIGGLTVILIIRIWNAVHITLFLRPNINTIPIPFAIRKMFTDGKSIFAEISQKENDSSLLDLINKQFQLGKIIEPLLYKCIDFDNGDYVERWWPLGKKGNIVLDPARNMGQPILNKYNVKTELIYELYKTNHSISEISDWYELDKNAIQAAISFEEGLVA